MSERGGFVSQFIYCERCLRAVLESAARCGGDQEDKTFSCRQLGNAPMVSGRLGAYYPAGEIDTFGSWAEDLAGHVCHPVRFAVLTDCGNVYGFVVQPGEGAERVENETVEGWPDR